MNRARKIAWFSLGLGAVVLAGVSFYLGGKGAPEAVKTAPSVESAKSVDPENDEPGVSEIFVGKDAKPPSAKVPAFRELPAPREGSVLSEKENARLREELLEEPRDKTSGIPAIKDTPPLKLSEPLPLNPPPSGERQAFNEFDVPPAPEPPAEAGDSYWQPAPEPSDPMPNPSDEVEPPPMLPPSDIGSDFQPEPTDNFDFGGTGD